MAKTAGTSGTGARRPHVWVAQNWWMEEIFDGVAEVAAEKGWTLDSGMRWSRPADIRAPENVDGAIVFTGDYPGLFNAVKTLGVPVVDIEDRENRYGAPKVVISDEEIGEKAALHLAAGMPDRLIFVRCRGYWSEVLEARCRGFVAGAGKAGVPVDIVREEDFDPVALAASGHAGIFPGVDSVAIRLLERCVDAGVAVPDRIAVLGANDFRADCELARVPLSSVSPGFKNKGRAAAELLARLLAGAPAPKTPVVIPVSDITLRKSTRSLATGHPTLDRLARHFRENAHRPVGVNELCEECSVPKRTATHLIRAKYDLTPLELLDECRLILARRFEASGTLPRKGVAASAGFGRVSALERAEEASRERGGLRW